MPRLVEWPELIDAPDIRERLQAIRPTAELLYTWDGVWMLGEVLPNRLRREEAAKLFRLYEERVILEGRGSPALHRGFWRDATLLYQGFTWIKDYQGDPDGRIVEDYRRMCWKEESGQLDKEYMQMVANSSDDNKLREKMKWWQNEGRYGLKNALRYTTRRPVSIPNPKGEVAA